MKLVKAGLFVLGIGALALTVHSILWPILQLESQPVWWWTILQWPMEWFYFFGTLFHSPKILFHLSIFDYLRILIAFLSPFAAAFSARKFGFSKTGQVGWFIAAFLLPFTLLLMVTVPVNNIDLFKKRMLVFARVFLISLFWIGLGLFILIPSGSGGVVYLRGARWFGTDNPSITILITLVGFLFAGFGIIGIVLAILVAFGLLKPEKLERFVKT